MANAQYYGWAFQNRAALLPTRSQIAQAAELVAARKKRLLGQMDILFVTPDYYSERPKPCMNGWATRFLTVNPVGDVLPCPTASAIKGHAFRQCSEPPAGLDLESIRVVQSFSRHRMDAGALLRMPDARN